MTDRTPDNTHPRDTKRLLDVPRTMAGSHMLTQAELWREAATPAKTPFHRATDYLKIKGVLWAWHYLKSRFGGRYPFAVYPSDGSDDGVYELASGNRNVGPVKLAMAGDWGTGTEEANKVGALMDDERADFTIHLGDVYYVGTKKEIVENMFGAKATWPIGTRGSFCLNSNHEMYARGKGYFKYLLPKLGVRDGSRGTMTGQKASYFALRNDHWLVIGLDTGYYSVGKPFLEKLFKPSCRLHNELMKWLKGTVRIQDDDSRGIVLLSHHQYYSQFESQHPRAARQLSELIERPVLWFWGHEHRIAIYGKHAAKHGKLTAYGRCVGHGGMPVEAISELPKADAKHAVGLVFYDKRERQRIGKSEIPIGFNGFATLEFDGPRLTVRHIDAEQGLLLEEAWRVGEGGQFCGERIEQHIHHHDLVVYSGNLHDAIV